MANPRYTVVFTSKAKPGVPPKRSLLRLIVLTALVGLVAQGIILNPSLHFWKKDATVAAPQAHTLHSLLALTLPDLAQQPQSLTQWSGRVVVVNFWATWCEPCKDEMPMLDALQKEFTPNRVQFVGVGIDEPKNMQAWLKTHPTHYPILVGTDQTLALTAPYGNAEQGVPFTAVFSPKGELVAKKLGAITEKELRALIAQAMI